MAAIQMIHAENLEAMHELLDAGRRFTLAYLDPPFFTGRDFRTSDGEFAFSDKWASFDAYLDSVMDRFRTAARLLSDDGCIVLHVDPTVSHYLKTRCDGVMGRENFASEIVWRYRRWPARCRNYQRMHDVLLRWTTGRAPSKWIQHYEPLSEKTVATWANRSQHDRFDRAGKRRHSAVCAEDSPGAAMSDVWEIPVVPSGRAAGRGRSGYPTQKPEKLLERLVMTLTNPGDVVLDPYMGSGTSIAVCHRLGRGAVGIDSSAVAIRYASARLQAPPPPQASPPGGTTQDRGEEGVET